MINDNGIKTSVNRSIGVDKTISTQADIAASYQRKAEQCTERSRVSVENIGSEAFLTSRVESSISGNDDISRYRQSSLQPHTATTNNVPEVSHRDSVVNTSYPSQPVRPSTYTPKSISTQADVAASYQRKAENIGSEAFLTSRVESSISGNDNISRYRQGSLQPHTATTNNVPEVSHRDSVVNTSYPSQPVRPSTYIPKSISTQADVAASYQRKAEQGIERSRVSVENITDENNLTIKTAVSHDVGVNSSSSGGLKVGQRLSEAFLFSHLYLSAPLSDDAKEAIKEIKTQTEGGRQDLLKLYLSDKTSDEHKKFNQFVATKKIKADALREDIKVTLKKPTLKESGDSIRKEIFATYYETLLKYAKRPKTFKDVFSSQIKTGVLPSISTAVNGVGGVLSSGDDIGSQTIGATITAGQTAVEAGMVFSKAFIAVGKSPFVAAKAIANTPTTFRNVTVTVRNEVGDFVNSVHSFKGSVTNAPHKIKSVIDRNVAFAKRATKTIEQNGLLSKPVLLGTYRKLSKPVKEVAKTGVLVGGRAVAHTATKSAMTLAKGGVPTLINSTSALAFGVGSALGMAEDETIRGAGTLMTGVGYGIKTGVAVTKTTGYVVNTAVKTSVKQLGAVAEKTAEGISAVSQLGLKDTIRFYRNKILLKSYKKTQRAVEQSVRETQHFIINFTRNVKKYSVAVLAVVLAVVLVMTTITPVSLIGGTFSGTFSTIATVAKHIPIIGGLFKDVEVGDIEEFDVSAYLSDKDNGIPKLREKYINDVADYWNKQDCHYLRVRTEGYSGVLGDKSTSDGIKKAINSAFYSDKELVEIIAPIFNAIILTKYDLQPTDKQAEKVLKDVFNSLFSKPKDIPSVTTTEYCGQLAGTGVGTPYKDNKCQRCIKYHNDMTTAIPSSCPNYHIENHKSMGYDHICCNKCDKEYYLCGQKIENGGEPNKVCDNANNELIGCRPYGHWEGKKEWEDGYDEYGNKRQIQHFHQHGCVAVGQRDVIERVWISYETYNGTYPKDNWSHWGFYESHIATDDEIKQGFMIVDGIKYTIDNKVNNSCCTSGIHQFSCDDFYVCDGHKVITLNFNLSGYEKLVEENFTKRIKELKDKDEDKLSDDEKNELQSLKDGKELAEEYLKLQNENTIEKSQLKDINWAVEEKDLSDNQKKERDKAISQAGKIGGTTYINWYYDKIGLSAPKDVNWSGCFICWVKNRPKFSNPYELEEDEDYIDNRTSDKTKFIDNIKTLESGDIVFFNVTGAKTKIGIRLIPERCGYVIGRDDEYLYVIEGYRFDTVQITKYTFNDARIIDYSKRGDDYWK